VTAPDGERGSAALLAMFFAYGGWEDALVPSGEVKEPPAHFALRAQPLVWEFAGVVYTLLQYVTVATIGNRRY